jgi:hypothetical protein
MKKAVSPLAVARRAVARRRGLRNLIDRAAPIDRVEQAFLVRVDRTSRTFASVRG